MRINILLGQVIIIILLGGSCTNAPVGVCPDNMHYFMYKGKALVLVTSDHHYGAVTDRDFDYVKYLDYLSANGMNLTRIYPGAMFEPPDKYLPGNPLGPKPGRQILPWAKSEQPGANPLLSEEERPSFKYDLDKWNDEYFERLKDFLTQAGSRDIIVEVAFFNGMYYDCWPLMAMYHQNNVQNTGNYESEDCGLFTMNDPRNSEVMRYQKAYIRKITTELNRFNNLIYDICDEPSLQGLRGGGIILLPDSLVKPWITEMKEAFLETEASLPKKHLLGQTVQNLSPDCSDESWCKWLPTEYVGPAAKALTLNYKDNKPLVNVESNYFGMSLTKNAYTADAVRLEGWWFMLGGGAGCINLNGELYRGSEGGGQITKSVIVPQKKVLKDFMGSFDLRGMKRYENIESLPEGVICNALAEDGIQYALYLFHGAIESEWGAHFITSPGHYTDTLRMDRIPAGNYELEWINPETGKIISSEKFKWKGGLLSCVTPMYEVDIAMRMKKK